MWPIAITQEIMHQAAKSVFTNVIIFTSEILDHNSEMQKPEESLITECCWIPWYQMFIPNLQTLVQIMQWLWCLIHVLISSQCEKDK